MRFRNMLAPLLGSAVCACVAPQPADISRNDMRPIVIGHRGASGYHPEHTLESYALAVQQGADFIEPDLVITRDGVLIARHENEIGGTTDVANHPEFAERRTTKVIDGRRITGWFAEDFTLAEIRTLRARERLAQLRTGNARFDGKFGIPTFDEILAWVRRVNDERAAAARRGRKSPPTTIGIYAETKHPTYFRTLGKPLEEPLIVALRRSGLDRADAPAFIQSFETANLRMLKNLTRVRLIQLLDDSGAPFDFIASGSNRTYADLVTPSGLADIAEYAHGIGPTRELVIPRREDGTLGQPTDLVRDAHSAGLKVHAWTFRAENTFLPANFRSGEDPAAPGDLESEIRAYLDAGVDGVFADHPDLAVRARNAWDRD